MPAAVQSNAKLTYLLGDADLARLGHLERQNPRHKEFTAMKMLLVSQVRRTQQQQQQQVPEAAVMVVCAAHSSLHTRTWQLHSARECHACLLPAGHA